MSSATLFAGQAPLLGASRASPLDAVLSHFEGSLGASRRLQVPRTLIYLTALTALAIGAWIGLASVDQVVRTQGRIIPSGKPQIVQHLEGGIVSQVYVREGDVVAKGQNLIAVSDLLANSTRGEKRAKLDGLIARQARLQAEADGAARIVVPRDLAANSGDMRNESDGFLARQAKLHQSTRILEQQLAQKRQEVTEAEGRQRSLAGELDVARQQLVLVTGLLSRNAGSQLELLEAKARVERLSTQIRDTEASMPRLGAATQELQARVAEVGAQFRSEAQASLSETYVDLQRLRQELKGDDDRVKRTVVVAPEAGTINKLFANTVGGVVKPGETLLELTPADEAVVIEARVSPAERGALQIGQRAIVRVAAFDYTVYGTITGKISEISADSLADERGERYFRVGVAVDPESRRHFAKPLTPGMTVSADAVTGNRTVLAFLLSPIRGLASTALRDRK
jgi:adhesin transport system membrane fusion protein